MTNGSLTSAEIRFEENQPLRWLQHTVLVAVSGGADSVALLRLFHRVYARAAQANIAPLGRLVVAHANHQLRGTESDQDERFVRELCEQLGVPLVSRRLEIPRTADGLEQDARAARYAFLYQTACEVGARYVATAHHQDDQIETILHRILRGTGLDGLRGMAKARLLGDGVSLIRPLLGISRAEILEFLEQTGNGVFRTDSSNQDWSLTRNRIRGELLPYLRKHFGPQVDASLLRLGEIATETQAFLEELAEEQLETVVRQLTPRQFHVDAARLRQLQPVLAIQVLRLMWTRAGFPLQSMGKREWNELRNTLCEETDSVRVFPGNVRVSSHGEIQG